MPPRVVRLQTANNDFQHAEVLRRNRHKRQRYGEFFVEGVRPLNQALHHGWTVNAFLYAPERGLSDWALNILRTAQAAAHFELPPDLMAALSGKLETSELIALLAMPEDDLKRIPVRENPLIVLFDRPVSPGNLGTLIRSCDALGADGLILSGHGADLYDPETISASRGSLFALPAVRVGGPGDVLPWLEEVRARAEVTVLGTDEGAEPAVWDVDLRRGVLLLVGNETWGLSAAYKDTCDEMVRIPMFGTASSINVAAAASIVLYEIERQRKGVSDT